MCKSIFYQQIYVSDCWNVEKLWRPFSLVSYFYSTPCVQKASTPSIFMLEQSFKDHCKAKCIRKRCSALVLWISAL